MKRIIAFAVVIAVVICCCTTFYADSVYRFGDWTLSLIDTAEDYAFGIRSYDGNDTVVTVPDDYGGYPIIEIEGYAFATNMNVQEVILNDQLITIGDGVFAQCKNLTKIVIPDTVTQIGDNAFLNCDQVVVYASAESYAIAYAKEHEIEYVCQSVETYVLGDADGDGEVTILDATTIQRRLADLPTPSFDERAADADGNGLDITDATKIQRYLAEFDDPYHIGEFVSDKT